MEPDRGPASESARTRRFGWIGAGGLLALYVALVLASARAVPPTADEPLYTAAAGKIVSEWHWDSPYLRFQGPFGLYFNQLFASDVTHTALLGERKHELIAQARRGLAIPATLMGLGVFLWSRRLFGSVGGLFSLAVFVLNPMMIGYAAQISVDLVHAATTLFAAFATWTFLRRPGWRRALVFGLGAGLCIATKFLAILLVPSLVALALGFGVRREVAGGGHLGRILRGRFVLVVLAAVFAFVTMHATYAFQVGGAPTDPAAYESDVLQRAAGFPASRALMAIVPEPYVIGMDERLVADNDRRRTYAMGDYSKQRDAFLWAYLLKTPDLVVVLFFAWLVSLVARLRRGVVGPDEQLGLWLFGLCSVVPLAILSFAIQYKVGIRYVLQYLPLFYVLVGSFPGVVRGWIGGVRAPGLRRWIPPALAAVFLAHLAWEVAANRPNLIAYYNRASGGKAQAYRYFLDSNSDWGQFRERGAEILAERDPEAQVLRGYAGPRFGRVAMYVAYLRPLHLHERVRRWQWLDPFAPVDHFEAAWYVFDVSEERFLEAAAGGDPRVCADLAVAYLMEGRDAEAAEWIQRAEPDVRKLLERFVEARAGWPGAEATPKERRQALQIATELMERAPELVTAFLALPGLARDPDAVFLRASTLIGVGEYDAAIALMKNDQAFLATAKGVFLLAGLYLRLGYSAEALALLDARPDLKEALPEVYDELYRGALYIDPERTMGLRGNF